MHHFILLLLLSVVGMSFVPASATVLEEETPASVEASAEPAEVSLEPEAMPEITQELATDATLLSDAAPVSDTVPAPERLLAPDTAPAPESFTAPQENLLLDLQEKINHLQKQSQELLARLEQLEFEMRQKKTLTPTPSSQPISKAVKGVVKDPSPKDIFEDASKAMRRGDMESAEQGFKMVLSKNPVHSLVGQSHYWLGEIQFLQNNYHEAALAFSLAYQAENKTKVPAGQSDRRPEILFKLATSLKKLGSLKDAKITLKKLQQEFPKLPANLQGPVKGLQNELGG